MTSANPEAIVLCWGAPQPSDRRVSRIAGFLGVEAPFVSMSSLLADGNPAGPLRSTRRAAVLVNVETLAIAADVVPGGFEGLRALTTGLADHVFVHGFRPGPRHAAVLLALSSGRFGGVESAPAADLTFHVSAGVPEWCGQFSGLSFQIRREAQEFGFLTGPVGASDAEVMIRAGAAPFFVRVREGAGWVCCAASAEIADLDQPVGRPDRPLDWFAGLAPVMMFLRGSMPDRVWRNDAPLACLIIDDPLLRKRYGFLEYRRLAESMRRHRFSLCIAFIPWNYRRSRKDIAQLFSAPGSRFSLCVHGCDHTRGEFASTDVGVLREKARTALERMQAHQKLAGPPFQKVMVFPQGLFSTEAMVALKASGYVAAVNSAVCPSTEPRSLTLQNLLDVAVTKFSGFPVFGRRYPEEVADVAFDLFLGKPALIVEHHGYFRNGYQPLEAFVDAINALDDRLEWTDVGSVCSRTALTRTSAAGDTEVRFYTDQFRLTNDGPQPRNYSLLQPVDHGRLTTVLVNGRKADRRVAGEYARVRVSLEPGHSADVVIQSAAGAAESRVPKQAALVRARVWARRRLSEFRDNHVDTSPVLTALVNFARSTRRHAAPTAALLAVRSVAGSAPRAS